MEISTPSAILFVCLVGLGAMLKASPIKDWLIPFLLGAVGTVAGWKTFGGLEGAMQGFAMAAFSVYGHQLFRQWQERNGGKPVFPLKPLIVLACVTLVGCAELRQGSDVIMDNIKAGEPKADEAAKWIDHNAGLIRVGVQMTAIAVIYGTQEGDDRSRVIVAVREVANNLYRLMVGGQVDPDAVRDALRIKESWFVPIADGAANLYESAYWRGMKNGYKNCAEALLKAVCGGLLDATGGADA